MAADPRQQADLAISETERGKADMEENTGAKLFEIMGSERWKLLSEPSACSALFQEKAGLPEDKIALLIAVLKGSTGSKLRETAWKKNIEITDADLALFIQESQEPGYDEADFRWAMETWAGALGVTARFKTARKTQLAHKVSSAPKAKPAAPAVSSPAGEPAKSGGMAAAIMAAVSSLLSKFRRTAQKAASDASGSTGTSDTDTQPTAPQTGMMADTTATDPSQIQPAPAAAAAESDEDGWWAAIPEAEAGAKRQEERAVLAGTDDSDRHKRPVDAHRDKKSARPAHEAAPATGRTTSALAGIWPLMRSRRILASAALIIIVVALAWLVNGLMTDSGSATEGARLAENSPAREEKPQDSTAPARPSEPETSATSDVVAGPTGAGQPTQGQSVEVTDSNNNPQNQPEPGSNPVENQNKPLPAPSNAGTGNPPAPASADNQAVEPPATASHAADNKDEEPPVSRPSEPVSGRTGEGTEPSQPSKGSPGTSSAPATPPSNPGVGDLPKAEEIFNDLRQTSQTPVLFQKLQHYKNQQLLGFGKKNSFGSTEGLLVFVCNQNQVKDIYLIVNKMYRSIGSNKEYADISASLAADEREIWVQIAQ